jgi:hypothetical protein
MIMPAVTGHGRRQAMSSLPDGRAFRDQISADIPCLEHRRRLRAAGEGHAPETLDAHAGWGGPFLAAPRPSGSSAYRSW